MQEPEFDIVEQGEERKKLSRIQQLWEQLGLADHAAFAKYLPYILFIAFLGWVHIANNHKAIKYVREINSIEHELKELRWEYMTTKSELMFQSKQSEVAKAVSEQGLKELTEPPFIIQGNDDQ